MYKTGWTITDFHDDLLYLLHNQAHLPACGCLGRASHSYVFPLSPSPLRHHSSPNPTQRALLQGWRGHLSSASDGVTLDRARGMGPTRKTHQLISPRSVFIWQSRALARPSSPTAPKPASGGEGGPGPSQHVQRYPLRRPLSLRWKMAPFLRSAYPACMLLLAFTAPTPTCRPIISRPFLSSLGPSLLRTHRSVSSEGTIDRLPRAVRRLAKQRRQTHHRQPAFAFEMPSEKS